MHQERYWVCEESVHEESHGIGPAPIMCRTSAAFVKGHQTGFRLTPLRYLGNCTAAHGLCSTRDMTIN
jgi:hypothetical protein